MAHINDVLTFWFDDPDAANSEYGQQRKVWFVKNPAFDQEIIDRFLSTYEQAIAGHLDDWQQTPSGCLALLIVLDQFSRNMFRGTPRAFAADAKALAVAKDAIAKGFDRQVEPFKRIFFYLPLEHSENLGDQHHCVLLYQQLCDAHGDLANVLEYAVRHREVIERFGRFPHRNAILGRESIPEEIEFLKQPGSSF